MTVAETVSDFPVAAFLHPVICVLSGVLLAVRSFVQEVMFVPKIVTSDPRGLLTE